MNEKIVVRRQNAFLSCAEESRSKVCWDYNDFQYSVSFGEVSIGVWLIPATTYLLRTVTITVKTDLMAIAQELMAAELFMLNVRERFRLIDDEQRGNA